MEFFKYLQGFRLQPEQEILQYYPKWQRFYWYGHWNKWDGCSYECSKNFNLTSLNITNGQTFGISWVTTGISGADNGIS